MIIQPGGNVDVIRGCLKLLNKQDRVRTFAVLIIQIVLAFMDLIGVGIIGALGALTLTSATAKGPGNRLSILLQKFGIIDFSVQKQAMILGLVAAIVLIAKTILSMWLLKRTNLYLGRRGARLSADLIEKVFKLPYLRIREQSLMSWQFQLTTAIDVISTGIITTSLLMVSDMTLLVILCGGLFIVEPSMALSALVLFVSGAMWTYRRQHKRTLEIGSELASKSIQTNETMQVMFDSYRDLHIRAAFPHYSKMMRNLRLSIADLNATRVYMPYVGKFTLEILLVVGFLFISASQFLLNESSRAVANIAIFLVASARISPAVLRIQQGLLMIKGNRGQARSAFALIQELQSVDLLSNSGEVGKISGGGAIGLEVEVQRVSFKYPKNPIFALKNISFKVESKEAVAVVGSSGSGKSTLIDLILGILNPDQGKILVDSKMPSKVLRDRPGSISFVPQKIVIANRTVRENLALGLEEAKIEDQFFWNALDQSQLGDFFRSQPEGLETLLGVGGIDLSGGQVQRIGLARALLTQPNLLILDEATSSLDGKTEHLVTEALGKLRGTLTLIVIAHRLSTIKNFQKVIYMKDGEIIAVGNFKELIGRIPDLAEQAELMKMDF